MLYVTGIPAFQDNYLWLIHDQQHAVAVDPGDHAPILAALAQHQLQLCAILLTHHHADHISGIEPLRHRFHCPVYGPHEPRIPHIDIPCSEAQRFMIPELDLNLRVLEVPGHTRSHIAYYTEHVSLGPSLFCGDTLFAGGCGRLFEGSAEQMLASLTRISALPDATRVYCAHEYTASNLAFALTVEPDNNALKTRAQTVTKLRQLNKPTVPSVLIEERQTNPFLRTDQSAIIKAAERFFDRAPLPPAEVFAAIRELKNNHQF